MIAFILLFLFTIIGFRMLDKNLWVFFEDGSNMVETFKIAIGIVLWVVNLVVILTLPLSLLIKMVVILFLFSVKIYIIYKYFTMLKLFYDEISHRINEKRVFSNDEVSEYIKQNSEFVSKYVKSYIMRRIILSYIKRNMRKPRRGNLGELYDYIVNKKKI